MRPEGWICKYEIRDDGVYLDGKKVAETTAIDMVRRFNFEQELFIGSRSEPSFFKRFLRRIGNNEDNTGQ